MHSFIGFFINKILMVLQSLERSVFFPSTIYYYMQSSNFKYGKLTIFCVCGSCIAMFHFSLNCWHHHDADSQAATLISSSISNMGNIILLTFLEMKKYRSSNNIKYYIIHFLKYKNCICNVTYLLFYI
jgi:hypothetical protein